MLSLQWTAIHGSMHAKGPQPVSDKAEHTHVFISLICDIEFQSFKQFSRNESDPRLPFCFSGVSSLIALSARDRIEFY